MIGRIFLVTLTGFAIAALITAFIGIRQGPVPGEGRWLKLVVYFLIVHVVLACAALGRAAMAFLVALILLAGGLELYRATARVGPAGEPRRYLIWLAYGLIGIGLANSLMMLSGQEWIFLYLIVAGFDGFSQIVGQWLGRRPLAPVISPRKTVEGAAGGFAAALALALMVRGLIGTDIGTSVALAAVLAGVALAGDLSASWVKRRARIKDYGHALPGQGGVLDRFDSFLLAGAVAGPLLSSVRV